jgi:hypothetical protein
VEQANNQRFREVMDSGEPYAGAGARVHLALPR